MFSLSALFTAFIVAATTSHVVLSICRQLSGCGQLSDYVCLYDADPVGVKEPESEQGKASVAQGQPGGAGSGRCGSAGAASGVTTPEGQHHGLRRRQLVRTQQYSHASHAVPAAQTTEQTMR